ncbi:MAG: hypothetical protein COT74_12060 [Bdellovibrionales bacterium CG10_big_fil_rev_8_21_14_0_10_45_34]|nr:MAG: hypothetical protein COT74_12060 [Bdellovibrionales bacterium CG10_big_fil_rev_8_21_14_0_10_45_34]
MERWQPLTLFKARESDDAELCRYWSQLKWSSSVDILKERRPPFFSHYRLQTDDYDSYLLRDEKEIVGMGSFLFREGLVGGMPETIGFATDLSISHDRRAITTWAQHFLPVLRGSTEPRGCRYVFTVFGPGQLNSFNSLIRPRTPKRAMPRFYLVRKFKAVSIHGFMPFVKPVKAIHVRNADINDLEVLSDYLKRKSSAHLMAFNYNADLLNERFRRWPNFSISDFLMAFDGKKNLIGCVAPWQNTSTVKYHIDKVTGFSLTLQSTFFWTSLLGITNRFPKTNSEIPFSHLTHFYYENPDVMMSLAYHAFRAQSNSLALIYPSFQNSLRNLPPSGCIRTELPFSLYVMMPPEADLPGFLGGGELTADPDIELALI